MKSFTSVAFLLLAAGTLAAQSAGHVSAGSDGRHVVVTLSHPSQPATLNVTLAGGSVIVKGTSRHDVVINSQPAPGVVPLVGPPPAAAPPGMHRLDSSSPNVSEDNNVVTIAPSPLAGTRNLEIQVPVSTSVHINAMRGNATVTGVTGDVNVETMNGDITLGGLSGSVVAHALRGKITAGISHIAAKPSSFSSMNGDIDVTLPAGANANLRLQDDRGSIFLDNAFHFTRTASASLQSGPSASLDSQAIASADAQLKAVDSALKSGDAAMAQQAQAEAQVAAAQAQALSRQMLGDPPPAPPAPNPAPQPPPPPPPPATTARLAGQLDQLHMELGQMHVDMDQVQLISGTLNGGGPELRFQDFRGNIYLHQAK